MFELYLSAIGFTLWALGLYALLPKAFSLHLKQNSRRTKALKQPVRLTWKTGAFAAASLVIMILVKLSEI